MDATGIGQIVEQYGVSGLLMLGLVYFRQRAEAAEQREREANERYIRSLQERITLAESVRRIAEEHA